MAEVTGTGTQTRVLTARSIMGDDVVNTAGEHVGDVLAFASPLRESGWYRRCDLSYHDAVGIAEGRHHGIDV